MAKRFKKSGKRDRTFIAQWRLYRGLSQDELADLIGTTGATVSRIESTQAPYSQDFLEECAKALRCTAADLISRAPSDGDDEIARAIALLQQAKRT